MIHDVSTRKGSVNSCFQVQPVHTVYALSCVETVYGELIWRLVRTKWFAYIPRYLPTYLYMYVGEIEGFTVSAADRLGWTWLTADRPQDDTKYEQQGKKIPEPQIPVLSQQQTHSDEQTGE